jgi:phenolic acid decarboxylase
MNEHIIAAIREAKKQGKLFYYSWTANHTTVDICLDCDAICVPDKYRDEVESNLL